MSTSMPATSPLRQSRAVANKSIMPPGAKSIALKAKWRDRNSWTASKTARLTNIASRVMASVVMGRAHATKALPRAGAFEKRGLLVFDRDVAKALAQQKHAKGQVQAHMMAAHNPPGELARQRFGLAPARTG